MSHPPSQAKPGCRGTTVGTCGECDRVLLVLEFDSAKELSNFLRAPWAVEDTPQLRMSQRRRAQLEAEARRIERERREFLKLYPIAEVSRG